MIIGLLLVGFSYAGAVIAIQTLGDFFGFNLARHILVTDQDFYC